ncbi:MAG: hypothetical protein V3T88_09145 [Nitrosomonadaceae bacterium]
MSDFEDEIEAITTAWNNELDCANSVYAQMFLGAFREAIDKHDTHRHVLTICAGMGHAFVMVDGKIPDHYPDTSPIMVLIRAIDRALDWKWAHSLDWEKLNGGSDI